MADDGSITLIGGFSHISGHHHFPLGPVCPYTGADDVEQVLLPRDGHLWAWTAVTHPPPGYEGPSPTASAWSSWTASACGSSPG